MHPTPAVGAYVGKMWCTIADSLVSYIRGFSAAAGDVIDKFDFPVPASALEEPVNVRVRAQAGPPKLSAERHCSSSATLQPWLPRSLSVSCETRPARC